MTGAPRTQPPKTFRLTAGVGIVLIVAAALVTPPGIALISLGSQSIESRDFQVVGWALASLLLVAGIVLISLRRRLSSGNLLLASASVVFSVLVAEASLALAGFETPHHLVLGVPPLSPTFNPDRELGTRVVRGKYFRPGWPINEEGFGDSDAFRPVPEDDTSFRVLFIGDSFTFGVNASKPSNTFVNIIEESLQRDTPTIVWNTGIPGTGQPEHWLYLQTFGPRLKPHLVILPFCTNDFSDNFFPPGAYYVFEPNLWVNRYAVGPEGTIIQLIPGEAYRRAMGAPKEISDYIAISRVGYLLLSALTQYASSLSGANPSNPGSVEPCPGYDLTKGFLIKIRDFTASNNAGLLLVPIPFVEDLRQPSKQYRAITKLCKELNIESLDVRDRLCEADYSTADRHWNDSGHKKVADALLLQIQQILALKSSSRSFPVQ